MITKLNDLLGETRVFDGMAGPYLELISNCGQLIHFNPDDFLLRAGDSADRFFLIRRGEVAIESHTLVQTHTISKVGAGRVVGFSWLFSPYRNLFDVRALGKVYAIQLNGKCLREKAETDPILGYDLMQRFARVMLERLQATQHQMLNVYHQPVKKEQ